MKVHGKEYHFRAYEMIRTGKSRKWIQEEMNGFAEEYGNMKLVSYLDDEKKYMRVCIYEKN